MKPKFDERTFVKPETENLHKSKFPDHWERYRFASQYVNAKQVLDVACGCGYGTALLSQSSGIKAVGLDVDAMTISWAKKYYGSFATYEMIKGNRWPINNESIDVVVSLETLEHILDPSSFIDEIDRVLAVNGILILSTPHNDSESRFNPTNPFHLREYSWDELADLFSHRFVIMSRWSQISNLSKNWNSAKNSRTGFLFVIMKNFLPNSIILYMKRMILSKFKGNNSSILLGKHTVLDVQVIVACKK